VNPTARWGLLGLAFAVSACSVLESDKVDYKSATKAPTLEVPPDLTQLSQDSRYTVPGGAVSAAAFEAGKATSKSEAQSKTAIAQIADVRIERDGDRRWLVVDRPADKLWEPVREFWQENGFNLVIEQPELGIMETDWAENRAKIPQDFIRSTIGKVFDSLYSNRRARQIPHPLRTHAHGGHRNLHHPPRHGRGLCKLDQRLDRLAAAQTRPPNSKPNFCAA